MLSTWIRSRHRRFFTLDENKNKNMKPNRNICSSVWRFTRTIPFFHTWQTGVRHVHLFRPLKFFKWKVYLIHFRHSDSFWPLSKSCIDQAPLCQSFSPVRFRKHNLSKELRGSDIQVFLSASHPRIVAVPSFHDLEGLQCSTPTAPV